MCDLFLIVWRDSFFCSRDGLLVGITGMIHLYPSWGLSGRLGLSNLQGVRWAGVTALAQRIFWIFTVT